VYAGGLTGWGWCFIIKAVLTGSLKKKEKAKAQNIKRRVIMRISIEGRDKIMAKVAQYVPQFKTLSSEELGFLDSLNDFWTMFVGVLWLGLEWPESSKVRFKNIFIPNEEFFNEWLKVCFEKIDNKRDFGKFLYGLVWDILEYNARKLKDDIITAKLINAYLMHELNLTGD
jgi:hypothetical protein